MKNDFKNGSSFVWKGEGCRVYRYSFRTYDAIVIFKYYLICGYAWGDMHKISNVFQDFT